MKWLKGNFWEQFSPQNADFKQKRNRWNLTVSTVLDGRGGPKSIAAILDISDLCRLMYTKNYTKDTRK